MIDENEFISQKDSPAVIHHRYVRDSSTVPDGVYIFVEGPDDKPFYMNFVERFAPGPEKVTPYECQDKAGVYKVHRKVMGGERQGIVLFFVDKDLDDILHKEWEQAPEIYTTDYYSIENYLVTAGMLRKIWQECFRLDGTELEFDTSYRDKFSDELGRFYQYMLPLMAWVIYLYRNGHNPKVKEVRFDAFFDWGEDLILVKKGNWLQNGELERIEQICLQHEGATPSDWADQADNIMQELSALDPKAYIRGKLELSFFVRFVDQLWRFLDKQISKEGSKVTMSKPLLNEKNAMYVLGPRVSVPPPSLEKFLRENFSVQLPAN